MTTRSNPFTALRGISLAALLAAAASATPAQAQVQSWNYKSYMKDPVSGQYSKERFRTSTVKIEEKDGKATFRMITSGRGDLCISAGDLPAEVQRTPETTTITVMPPLAGCEPFRYVIKNDGSGGVRLFRKGDGWVPDGFDHDLTPAK